jgi:hypothetical protein
MWIFFLIDYRYHLPRRTVPNNRKEMKRVDAHGSYGPRPRMTNAERLSRNPKHAVSHMLDIPYRFRHIPPKPLRTWLKKRVD